MNYIAWPEFLKTVMPAGNSDDYWEKKLCQDQLYIFINPLIISFAAPVSEESRIQRPVLLSVKDFENKHPSPPPNSCSLEVTGHRTDFAALKLHIVGMILHLFHHGAAAYLQFLHVFRVQLQAGHVTGI